MNRKGQATTEMVFLLPILILVIGGGIALVYMCWQGLVVQQAANVAARIQGEERVGGGTSLDQIYQQNGEGPYTSGDSDPTQMDPKQAHVTSPPPDSVYEKYYKVVKKMFGAYAGQTFVPPPVIGQNVDQVTVARVISLTKLKVPGFKWKQDQAVLSGKAWGGEDTYMYGLPRWGKSGGSGGSNGQPEWKNLLRETANGNQSGGQ